MNRNRVYQKRKRYDFVPETPQRSSNMLSDFLKISACIGIAVGYVGCELAQSVQKFEESRAKKSHSEQIIQHVENHADMTHTVVIDSIPTQTQNDKKADPVFTAGM